MAGPARQKYGGHRPAHWASRCGLSGEVRGGERKGSMTYAYLSAEVLISRLGKTRPEINV